MYHNINLQQSKQSKNSRDQLNPEAQIDHKKIIFCLFILIILQFSKSSSKSLKTVNIHIINAVMTMIVIVIFCLYYNWLLLQYKRYLQNNNPELQKYQKINNTFIQKPQNVYKLGPFHPKRLFFQLKQKLNRVQPFLFLNILQLSNEEERILNNNYNFYQYQNQNISNEIQEFEKKTELINQQIINQQQLQQQKQQEKKEIPILQEINEVKSEQVIDYKIPQQNTLHPISLKGYHFKQPQKPEYIDDFIQSPNKLLKQPISLRNNSIPSQLNKSLNQSQLNILGNNNILSQKMTHSPKNFLDFESKQNEQFQKDIQNMIPIGSQEIVKEKINISKDWLKQTIHSIVYEQLENLVKIQSNAQQCFDVKLTEFNIFNKYEQFHVLTQNKQLEINQFYQEHQISINELLDWFQMYENTHSWPKPPKQLTEKQTHELVNLLRIRSNELDYIFQIPGYNLKAIRFHVLERLLAISLNFNDFQQQLNKQHYNIPSDTEILIHLFVTVCNIKIDKIYNRFQDQCQQQEKKQTIEIEKEQQMIKETWNKKKDILDQQMKTQLSAQYDHNYGLIQQIITEYSHKLKNYKLELEKLKIEIISESEFAQYEFQNNKDKHDMINETLNMPKTFLVKVGPSFIDPIYNVAFQDFRLTGPVEDNILVCISAAFTAFQNIVENFLDQKFRYQLEEQVHFRELVGLIKKLSFKTKSRNYLQ